MQAPNEWGARFTQPGLLHRPATQIVCIILGSLLCLGGLYALIATFAGHPNYPEITDFALYLNAADALPGSPYAEHVNPGFDRYGYPPLLADFLAALKSILGPGLILWVWPAACFAGLVGSIVLLCRSFGVRLPWAAVLLVVGIVLIGRIVRSDIVQGQVNIFVLLMLAGGIVLRSQDKVVAASILFAIMMSLKPFMGAVAIYFLVRGDWRMARWMLGMGALVFLISFLPMGVNMLEGWSGWRQATEYFTSPPFATKPDNQSAYGLALRLFTETPYATPWTNNPVLVPVLVGSAMIVSAVLAWIGLRLDASPGRSPPVSDPAVILLECSMIVALVTACGPLTEGNHMAITLAGFAAATIVGIRRLREGTPHGALWLASIAAWAAMVFFIIYPKILPIAYGLYPYWYGLEGFEILLTGRFGFLLMLAGGLTAVTLWQERVAIAAAPAARAIARPTNARGGI